MSNAGGPLLLLAQLANVARVLIGAGLVGGFVLDLPLAAVLGSLRDDRPRGRARRETG